jgi:hypothetical protein
MKSKHRTIVYIDGFNFYYGLLRSSPYKWLNIETLFEDLFRKQNEIVKIKYFTARVEPTSRDPEVQQRQDAYFRALHTTCDRVEFFFGHFLRHAVRRENVYPPPQTVRVWKNEEKGSDVNLAVQLLNDAWIMACECAIVVSNDSDLAESLRLVKSQHNTTIGLITPGAPNRKTSAQLSQYADFYRVIRSQALKKHQLPTNIPGTNIRKPSAW